MMLVVFSCPLQELLEYWALQQVNLCKYFQEPKNLNQRNSQPYRKIKQGPDM